MSEPTEPIWEVFEGISLLPLRTPTLPPASRTNSYLIGDPRRGPVLLVEPATPHEGEQRRLLGWLRERKVQVGALFCTHHHSDHVGGAEALREALRAPLWGHPETALRLRGQLRFDRLIEEGESLSLGPGSPEIRALHTPGHAPGHLCLRVFQRDRRATAVIAGDMVAGLGTILVEPRDGDMTLYLRSLERLRALRPSLLLPAHGPPLEDPEAILSHYIAHRLAREAKVLAALRALAEAGATPAHPAALLPGAYDDAPKIAWPLATRAIEAHLLKLEAEGRVRRAGERWDLNSE